MITPDQLVSRSSVQTLILLIESSLRFTVHMYILEHFLFPVRINMRTHFGDWLSPWLNIGREVSIYLRMSVREGLSFNIYEMLGIHFCVLVAIVSLSLLFL